LFKVHIFLIINRKDTLFIHTFKAKEKMLASSPSSSSSSISSSPPLRRPRRRRRLVERRRRTTTTPTVRASAADEIVTILKYFSAGGIGCFVSHCLSVPLDVVKTKAQLNPEDSKLSAWKLAQKIVREEGATTLARGLGATFFGYLVQGGCKYGGFETFKHFSGGSGGHANIAQLLLAATVAESIGSFALVPFERARVKIVESEAYAREKSLPTAVGEELDAFLNDIGESLVPVYLKMIPYTAVQLVSYDVLVNGFTLGVYGGEEGNGELFFALRLMSAIIAGVLATVASQPGDTIMTRRYCKDDEGEKEECEEVFDDDDNNAFLGLFVGLRQRIPMTVLIVVTQLITVDFVKDSLGV
jgi:solute carrier family 25 phosphate transporter 3